MWQVCRSNQKGVTINAMTWTDENGKEWPTHLHAKMWQPGVSGNPKGRPKGSISIRDKIRQYLEDNPMEVERLVHHFVNNNPELMWQMLEGRPAQAHMVGGPGGEPLGEPSIFLKELADRLNIIHGATYTIKPRDGGPSVGGDGVVPSTLGIEASNPQRGGDADRVS